MISSVRTSVYLPSPMAKTECFSSVYVAVCSSSLLSANLVLEDTVERIYHQDVFAEQWVGLFLIRGENVVLLGEIVSIHQSPLLFLSRFF